MARSDERQPRVVVTEVVDVAPEHEGEEPVEIKRTYERVFFGPHTGRRFAEVWVVDAKSTYPMQQVRIDDQVRHLRTKVGPGGRFHLGQGLPATFEAITHHQ